ncbi:hypothetical protein HAX54_016058, partial [Datura stramonium]|nr:hypothetical protein [Datura stramonium]
DEPKSQATPIEGSVKTPTLTKQIHWMVDKGRAPTVFHCPQLLETRWTTFVTPISGALRAYKLIPLLDLPMNNVSGKKSMEDKVIDPFPMSNGCLWSWPEVR